MLARRLTKDEKLSNRTGKCGSSRRSFSFESLEPKLLLCHGGPPPHVGCGGGGGKDTEPPAAVTDLAVAATTHNSMTLNWTATGDDGLHGTATRYDIRYSSSPIDTDADFEAAIEVRGESAPLPSGSPETFFINGLPGESTWYVALMVRDDESNFSGLSNVASGTTDPTPLGEWSIDFVDVMDFNGALYQALAYDSADNPTIAYGDKNNGLKFARFNGASWDIELVDAAYGGQGVDLAYDGNGNPSIVYHLVSGPDAGCVKFASRDPSDPNPMTAWHTETVDVDCNMNSYGASIAYDDNGVAFVSYEFYSGERIKGQRTAELRLARRNPASETWTKEKVAAWKSAGHNPNDNSLAFDVDVNGNLLEIPAITYARPGRTIDFAEWDVGLEAWQTETVDFPVGESINQHSLAFDPTTPDSPSVVYGASGEARLAHRDGPDAEWVVETFDNDRGWNPEMVYNSSGTAFISYVTCDSSMGGADTMRIVEWHGGDMFSDPQILESGGACDNLDQSSIAIDPLDPAEGPAVSYQYGWGGASSPNNVLKFARKNLGAGGASSASAASTSSEQTDATLAMAIALLDEPSSSNSTDDSQSDPITPPLERLVRNELLLAAPATGTLESGAVDPVMADYHRSAGGQEVMDDLQLDLALADFDESMLESELANICD